MSDYIPSVNFLSKDKLNVTDPAKIILGSDFDLEFNNIATAIESKAEVVPVFPPFEESKLSGDNVQVFQNLSNTNEIILETVDFTFTRPSTSLFEFSMGLNLDEFGIDLEEPLFTSNQTEAKSNTKLRITNLETNSVFDLDEKVFSYFLIRSRASSQNTFITTLSNSVCHTDFSESTLVDLVGLSSSGYRASIVLSLSFYTAGRTSARLNGNFSLYIKELFQ